MVINETQRRRRLRRAIQSAHSRLDAFVDKATFLAERQRYAQYLKAIWIAREPTERALAAAKVHTLYAAWPDRSVCNALRQGLLDLAHPPPDAGDHDASDARLTPGQALGVLYVLEGSGLGAQLPEQRVRSIGMTPTFGARHTARQTAQPKAWTGFVELLDQTRLDPLDDAMCIQAALNAFGAFERAFQAVGP